MRYDEYKDSGVEWIGEVPRHWEIVPIKYLSSCNDETLSNKTPKDTVINYVEISDVNETEGIKNTTEYTFAEAPSRARRITKKNDIIISTVRTYLKAVATVKEENLIVSTGFAVLRAKHINEEYLAYSLLSDGLLQNVISQSDGVSYPSITSTKLINISLPVAPLVEQRVIATYLDTECGKIDEMIATQNKRIALLQELKQRIITTAVTRGLNPDVEFKDSGVEWIGEVPKHWDIIPLKRTGVFDNGLTYSPTDVADSGYFVLRSSNIQNAKMDYSDTVFVKTVPQKLEVTKGDIIICSRNGSAALVGKCALFDGDFKATFGAFMMRYRPFIDRQYAYHLFQIVMGNYKGLFSTTTINQLTKAVIGEMVVPLPPKDEQRAIAAHLDKECARIDSLISAQEKRTELLQELKQSLITEVVTGKRKVC